MTKKRQNEGISNSAFLGYREFLNTLKVRIRETQVKAALSVNMELLFLYWEIGQRLCTEQEKKGWGAAVIPRLAKDLKNEVPEIKGFSERNIGRMLAFYREYPELSRFLPQAVAKKEVPQILPQPVAKIEGNPKLEDTPYSILPYLPWGHNILLLEKIKERKIRFWYAQQALENGWSRNILQLMIEGELHNRQGKASTNFEAKLPPSQSDLAKQVVKDPYLFDFLSLDTDFREQELEAGLVRHLETFLLELGTGFAFVGRQVRIEVGNDDFYIDLLFYHLNLRCFVVIELKTGAFKAEYAGKMNFYLNVVDDQLRHSTDQPSIGLVLCQQKDKILAEYALRGMTKAIGVSEYQLTRALPKELKSSLPSIEELESELAATPGKTSRKRGQA